MHAQKWARGKKLNFSKMEVRGFKSFADKVTIEFNDGVTAIIGPNGCGKSNIADAIRWTLGEQSAKSLRGKNMQDVIFNGTENRKSTSYCEVSLNFDNSKRQVFPNLDMDEVVITRKLDRSGNSEYQINKTRCRMKDIMNLIHDTGIGKEGYSIIGQGRVEEIMSNKPDDRRHIFEEAAGISKFRFQRTEAERKLDKAVQNLAVANERISEIETQLAPLRRQAENTKKFISLRDELKINELNQYIYQFDNNESVKGKIREKLQVIDDDLRLKEKQLSDCMSQYDLCMENISILDSQIKDYNNELLSLSVDQEKASGEGRLFKEQLTNLTDSQNRLDQEIKSILFELEVLKTQIEKENNLKDEKQNEFLKLSSEFKLKEAHLSSLSSSLSDQENLFETKNAEYIGTMEELSNLKSSLTGLMTEKGIQQERLKNLQSNLKAKKNHLEEETTALSIASSNLEKTKDEGRKLFFEQNDLQNELEEANESIESYNNDIMTFNTRMGIVEGNIQNLIKIKEDYAGYQGPVKALMNDAKYNENLKSRICGVVAEIIKVPEEYVTAVEYSLGGALQNIICETEDDASYLIDYLKQKRYGRITFKPIKTARPKMLYDENRNVLKENGCFGTVCDLISYDSKYETIMSGLLGDTVVVDNKQTAIYLNRKYRQSFKIITLDGDLFVPSGSITGGSRRNEKSNLLEQEEQIATAKASLEKLKTNIARMISLRDQTKNDLKERQNRIEEISNLLSENKVQVGLYEEKNRLASNNVETLKQEILTDSQSIEEIKASVDDIIRKVASIDELEKLVASKKDEVGYLSQHAKSSQTEQKTEKEALFAEVMNMRVQIATFKSEIDSHEGKIFDLERTESNLKQELLDYQANLKVVETNLSNLNNSPKRSSFTEKEQARLSYLKNELSKISTKKTELNSQLLSLDAQRTSLGLEKEKLAEKRVRDESTLERVDIEIRSMQEHILEEYDLTYSSALEFKIQDFDPKGIAQIIVNLKREIAKLGNVNMLAIETLQTTEERYTELTTERDDIQAGYDDLKKIIAELTDEMVTKFTNAFNQINENFQKIFKRLFDGGNGKLTLESIQPSEDGTMDLDPLEAGIEIFAQPPGKKLQNISLLSGGEKALTAIAILFAILELKPMPFCVLDEIEAALDDANASLFSEYLRVFSDKTQFIVITHRKPTMRNADTIYGVTMQEKGVTKTVKVTFEDALKQVKDLQG